MAYLGAAATAKSGNLKRGNFIGFDSSFLNWPIGVETRTSKKVTSCIGHDTGNLLYGNENLVGMMHADYSGKQERCVLLFKRGRLAAIEHSILIQNQAIVITEAEVNDGDGTRTMFELPYSEP